ncbi:MAG: hypothetical protein CM1200mP22_28020 [Dehalococcoidia bacterium]|nr:MAG: hypothetical protein CM1200mP22_28020 [Dehalococcoidia bacterium]
MENMAGSGPNICMRCVEFGRYTESGGLFRPQDMLGRQYSFAVSYDLTNRIELQQVVYELGQDLTEYMC